MGIIGSKCKVKVNDADIGEYVKYEKLNNVSDDDLEKSTKERKREKSDRSTLSNDSSSWDAVFTGVNHTGECKHSKSLSLTTQVSPKSTTTTDGDDVQSVSTLTSMLENPLLKSVKPDNPLYKRADGELRPVGPVHPWKLGKDKKQVRLELEEKGLIKSNKTKTAQEEIIGDLRNIGIISRNTINDNIGLTNELMRRVPARLAHLPLDTTKMQTAKVDDNIKPKLNANAVFSKSEPGFESTTLQAVTEEKLDEIVLSEETVSSDEKEKGAVSEDISEKKNKVLKLKIKILDTEML